MAPLSGLQAGVQVASLEPMVGASAGEASAKRPVPVVQKGTVIWRRTGEDQPQQPVPQANNDIQTLRAALNEVKGQTAQQVSELQARLENEQRALAQSTAIKVSELQARLDSSQKALAEATAATNMNIGAVWHASTQRAEEVAEQKVGPVAASLAELQQRTAADKLDPAQVRSIAQQTLADSTPEFKALALQTVQQSQDYIRATARAAVQDRDPAMQAALADAARDVIIKDDRVVFAIRKAVAEELQGVVTDPSATGAVSLGPDHGRAMLETTEGLDPNRLKIAALLAPDGSPASDAAKTEAKLATISPAAGPQGQSVTSPTAWSAQGTSLSRARNSQNWMDIRQYKVIVHEDNQTLESLLAKVLKNAEPFTGPWQVRWKVSPENSSVMQEKFSLDAETTFEEFVSYLAQYVLNDRGVKLTFSLFDNERIIVVSD